MKRRKRASRQQETDLRLASGMVSLRKMIAALATVLIAVAAVLPAFSPPGQQLRGLATPGSAPALTAAIVDQTSVYDTNPEFVEAATDILKGSGYLVDYYPGEEVTVDFYRELPAHGYDLILLRGHSAVLKEGRYGQPVDEVVLFTSEAYAEAKYEDDQGNGRLARALYYEGADPLFGIRADFITSSMRGDFDGATVIMMGCNGLTSVNDTALAFLARGAKSFTSWDDLIAWDHSDAATERILELMLVDGLDTVEAVERTAAEVGPDPYFGANLRILTPDG